MDEDRDRQLLQLRRDESPPPGLRARVQRTLRSRGLLARPPVAGLGALLAAGLAGVLLFAAGLQVGRRSPESGTAAGPRFALLLYQTAGFDRTTPESTLVVEYRDWARGLDGNRLIMGEKLGDDEQLLVPGKEGLLSGPAPAAPGPGSALAGLFIIRAGGWEEALAIARTCPHLKHGGVVAVKRVEAT